MNAYRSVVIAVTLGAFAFALGARIASAQEQEIPPKQRW